MHDVPAVCVAFLCINYLETYKRKSTKGWWWLIHLQSLIFRVNIKCKGLGQVKATSLLKITKKGNKLSWDLGHLTKKDDQKDNKLTKSTKINKDR